MRQVAVLVALLAGALWLFTVVPGASPSGDHGTQLFDCDEGGPLCAEPADPIGYNGAYTGHDEPSVLFYSNTPGSGYNQTYKLTIPSDPPTQPSQDGTGGTFNFQHRIAFWFGLALCDDQSGPNPGGSDLAGPDTPCTPDSDTNIYDGTQLTDPDYIGKHPGTAFMELQFYPPSWVQWPPGVSCDASKWCAALAIFQLNQNQNTGVANNADCLGSVSIEPANFAFITRKGTPIGPPGPLDLTTASFDPSASKVLMMQPGDQVKVEVRDTAAGLQTTLNDLTSGQSGSMTASVANGFAAVNYEPSASSCSETPHAWHPAYATSSEHTRVPWAAHGYNVAFSDEIGHFDYCSSVEEQGGSCTQPGSDPFDTTLCFAPPFQPPVQAIKVKIGGCIDTDVDFDGTSYQPTWPGATANMSAAVTPSPVRFTSPLFNGTQNYSRVAFEADLPRIEIASFSPNNNCNRTTGAGCVNPPNGANFYPFYTTADVGGQCVWQLGGGHIQGTTNTFGGTSTAAFGPLIFFTYPTPAGPKHAHEQLPQRIGLESLPRVGSRKSDMVGASSRRPPPFMPSEGSRGGARSTTPRRSAFATACSRPPRLNRLRRPGRSRRRAEAPASCASERCRSVARNERPSFRAASPRATPAPRWPLYGDSSRQPPPQGPGRLVRTRRSRARRLDERTGGVEGERSLPRSRAEAPPAKPRAPSGASPDMVTGAPKEEGPRTDTPRPLPFR
jgi:hypothetical protein